MNAWSILLDEACVAMPWHAARKDVEQGHINLSDVANRYPGGGVYLASICLGLLFVGTPAKVSRWR